MTRRQRILRRVARQVYPRPNRRIGGFSSAAIFSAIRRELVKADGEALTVAFNSPGGPFTTFLDKLYDSIPVSPAYWFAGIDFEIKVKVMT
jgi:hypothetical protein